MRYLPAFLTFVLLLGPGAQRAHAQAGLESYDLTPYRVMSIHGDWRVICTPVGMGSWNRTRDCAVEDRHGLILYVNSFGYFSFTMRGDTINVSATEGGPMTLQQDIDLTYVGPDTVIDFLQGRQTFGDGASYTVSLDGYADAQAHAISLME